MSEPNAPPEDGAAAVEDVEQLRQERDRYLDLLRRTQADFENYQKRNRREREQDLRYAHEGLALGLLPVLDNLDRALAAAKQAGEGGPLVQGVALVQTQLLDALGRQGVKPIEAAVGGAFDPNLHQAVMQEPARGQAPNTLVRVLGQGFTIHDRVLRPASVVVAS